MVIYNHDMEALCRRVIRFRQEAHKAASANITAMNPFDRQRLEVNLDALSSYLDHVQAQPLLDLPETSPMELPVADLAQLSPVENEAIADFIKYYELLYMELVNSQSARHPVRLISHDEDRMRAIISKMKALLSDYVDQHQPLDLPESSPKAAMSGVGKQGV